MEFLAVIALAILIFASGGWGRGDDGGYWDRYEPDQLDMRAGEDGVCEVFDCETGCVLFAGDDIDCREWMTEHTV